MTKKVTKSNMYIDTLKYSFLLNRESAGIRIYLNFFWSILKVTLEIFSLFVFKEIIDGLSNGKAITSLIWFIVVYFSLLISIKVIDSIRIIGLNTMRNMADHKYEEDLLSKISRIPLEIMDTSKGRDYIDNLYNNEGFITTFMFRMVDILTLAYTFGIALYSFMQYSLFFVIIFMVLSLPGILLEIIFSQKIDYFKMKTRPDVRRFCYYRWLVTDKWPAKDIRTYDLSDALKKRYNEEKEGYRRENAKLDRSEMNAKVITETIMRIGEIAFIIYVVFCCIRGEITIGTVTFLVGLSVTVIDSFHGFLATIVITSMNVKRLMGCFFEFQSFVPEKSGGERMIDSFETLEFDRVSFSYPFMDEPVLKDVSFKISKGDRLFLVGVNGAGKTTIIKLMLGLYHITSGRILVNGYDIYEYDRNQMNKLFAVLFQNFVEYSLPLRDNVSLCDWNNAKDDEKIIESLCNVGVYDDIKGRIENNGIDIQMTRRFDDEGLELSRGQWQKIALARAYFKDADVLVLDEPSASLDAEAEDAIFQKIENLSKNKTSIMISHRISNARTANVIIVLDGGKIIEKGTHEELLKLSGKYAELYNLQKKRYMVEEKMA